MRMACVAVASSVPVDSACNDRRNAEGGVEIGPELGDRASEACPRPGRSVLLARSVMTAPGSADQAGVEADLVRLVAHLLPVVHRYLRVEFQQGDEAAVQRISIRIDVGRRRDPISIR